MQDEVTPLRKEWSAPEVRHLDSGSAEAGTATGNDGSGTS